MILSLENVCAGYGKRQVLKDLSFQIRPHKMTAVLGKNGSGKSTLVSCINQQVHYTGRIVCQDRDIRLMTQQERARAVSILPQVLPSPGVTVEELVGFGRTPYLGWNQKLSPQDREQVERAMAFVQIEDMKEHLVSTLSGGERQRAFLAMVLAQDTRLMVLDEPTTYMDVAYQGRFMQLIHKLKGEWKKTLLVVMHDLSLALKYADYVVILEGGKVYFDGSVEECLSSPALEEVFGVAKQLFARDGKQYVIFDI